MMMPFYSSPRYRQPASQPASRTIHKPTLPHQLTSYLRLDHALSRHRTPPTTTTPPLDLAHRIPIPIQPHQRRIIPLALQILSKPYILQINIILANRRQAEPGNDAAQDGQRRGDPKRVLATCRRVGRVALDHGEHPRAHEGADFADGGRDAVVLAAAREGVGVSCGFGRGVGEGVAYRTAVALVLLANKPILSPGPISPKLRKMP